MEMEDDDEEDQTVNRLDPRYSSGVLSPGRHVRTRLYFTSESHIHSLLTILSEGGLVDSNDEQWQRAMEYVSLVSELNYMTQVSCDYVVRRPHKRCFVRRTVSRRTSFFSR